MTARPRSAAAPASIGTRAAASAADLLIACAIGVVYAAIAWGVGLATGPADVRALPLVFAFAAGCAWAALLARAVVAAVRTGAAVETAAVEREPRHPAAPPAPAPTLRAVALLPAPAPTPAPQTVVIRQLVGATAGPGASAGTSPWAPSPPAPTFAPLPGDAPVLAVLTWDDGTSMAVYERTLYGRNPAAEPGTVGVPVRDETLSLSKTHFEIGGDASGAWIADRHSTNGTVLVRAGERRPLVAGLPTSLRPGDRLELGDRTAFVGLAS